MSGNPKASNDPKAGKRCTAHNRQGAQCSQPAILGANVCRYHGGKAPQVVAAARLRLAMMVDPAIGTLAKLLKSKSPAAQLGAARDILDRAGLAEPSKLELSGADGAPLTISVNINPVHPK